MSTETESRRPEGKPRAWRPASGPDVKREATARKTFLPWLRGPARLEGEWIVLDAAQAEPYSPVGEIDLFFALAMLRTPADVPAFVRRYGLLWHGPGLAAGEYRERWSDWETEAFELGEALRRYRQVWRASAGDQEAIAALWEWERESRLAVPDAPPADSLGTVLNAVTDWLAHRVNRKLEGATVGLVPAGAFVETDLAARVDTRPGVLLYETRPRDLLGWAWVQCAKEFVSRVPVLGCPECGRSFHPTDARQRYCSPRCANRAAQRRWAEKKRAQA